MWSRNVVLGLIMIVGKKFVSLIAYLFHLSDCLISISVAAVLIRLVSITRNREATIHEFDPHFNYRATEYLVQHGMHAFLNWFDHQSWYAELVNSH